MSKTQAFVDLEEFCDLYSTPVDGPVYDAEKLYDLLLDRHGVTSPWAVSATTLAELLELTDTRDANNWSADTFDAMVGGAA